MTSPDDHLSPIAGPADDALMFELAPVSLWLEDYSALKAHVRRNGAPRA